MGKAPSLSPRPLPPQAQNKIRAQNKTRGSQVANSGIRVRITKAKT